MQLTGFFGRRLQVVKHLQRLHEIMEKTATILTDGFKLQRLATNNEGGFVRQRNKTAYQLLSLFLQRFVVFAFFSSSQLIQFTFQIRQRFTTHAPPIVVSGQQQMIRVTERTRNGTR